MLARKLLDRTTAGAAIIAAAILLLLMAMTVVDVALRNAGQTGVLGVVEYSATLLAAAVYLGAAYGDRMGAHVSTRLVTNRLPVLPANLARLVGAAVTVAFLAYLTWACADRAWYAFQINEYRYGLIQVPVWPSRIALTIGLGLFTLERLAHLLRLARGVRGKRNAPSATSGDLPPDTV